MESVSDILARLLRAFESSEDKSEDEQSSSIESLSSVDAFQLNNSAEIIPKENKIERNEETNESLRLELLKSSLSDNNNNLNISRCKYLWNEILSQEYQNILDNSFTEDDNSLILNNQNKNNNYSFDLSSMASCLSANENENENDNSEVQNDNNNNNSNNYIEDIILSMDIDDPIDQNFDENVIFSSSPSFISSPSPTVLGNTSECLSDNLNGRVENLEDNGNRQAGLSPNCLAKEVETKLARQIDSDVLRSHMFGSPSKMKMRKRLRSILMRTFLPPALRVAAGSKSETTSPRHDLAYVQGVHDIASVLMRVSDGADVQTDNLKGDASASSCVRPKTSALDANSFLCLEQDEDTIEQDEWVIINLKRLLISRLFMYHSTIDLKFSVELTLTAVSNIIRATHPELDRIILLVRFVPLLFSRLVEDFRHSHSNLLVSATATTISLLSQWHTDSSESHFAIPWMFTYFSHCISNPDDLLRLWNLILALPPATLPYLLAAVLVLQKSEVFEIAGTIPGFADLMKEDITVRTDFILPLTAEILESIELSSTKIFCKLVNSSIFEQNQNKKDSSFPVQKGTCKSACDIIDDLLKVLDDLVCRYPPSLLQSGMFTTVHSDTSTVDKEVAESLDISQKGILSTLRSMQPFKRYFNPNPKSLPVLSHWYEAKGRTTSEAFELLVWPPLWCASSTTTTKLGFVRVSSNSGEDLRGIACSQTEALINNRSENITRDIKSLQNCVRSYVMNFANQTLILATPRRHHSLRDHGLGIALKIPDRFRESPNLFILAGYRLSRLASQMIHDALRKGRDFVTVGIFKAYFERVNKFTRRNP